jgi:flavin-dependent dehydrogenase
MAVRDYDAIVIGGGPAGSTAATLIAQAGRRVLLLERRRTVPFKIGESLIPATYDTLKRLGMLGKLRRSRFPKKYSVQFFSGDGKASAPFYFHETDPSERSQTWQVLRSEFDAMMLENAREHGAEVRPGAAVKEILFDGGRAAGVVADLGDGENRELSCRVVIDATGQRSLLARRLKLRRQDPCLRMAAIFTHFEGAQRDPGIDEGATLILQTCGNSSWFWYIPLPDDRVSVGVVGPIDHLVTGRQGDPQRTFDEEVRRCPGLEPRIAEARRLMDVRVLNDFSYTSEKMAGDGWILAGDAFGFLDPIYSSGVLLALRSGEMAADAVLAALEAGDPSEERLRVFEGELRAGMASFRQLIYAFYSPDFSFARFLRAHPEHRRLIIDILVGDVFDRDFSGLFADIGRMQPLGETAVGQAV